MAASIPNQYYSDYTFSSDQFFNCPISANCTNVINENSSHMLNNIGAINKLVPWMNCDMNSPVSVASFPEQFGVSDCMVVPQLSEREMGFGDFSACHYKRQVFEPGEDCSEMVSNVWPPYHLVAENWVMQGKQEAKIEENEVKVGRYSVEERKDRILRYLKKRNQRNFNKTIKYACRKTLADKRVRVRGRFAKNNEACDDENETKTSVDICSDEENKSFNYENSAQMKYDEEDWLQAAMANLTYLPYTYS